MGTCPGKRTVRSRTIAVAPRKAIKYMRRVLKLHPFFQSTTPRLRPGAVAFKIKENPHLDYGYAVTSHSSQGQTADRVLVHVDAEQAGEKLVNRRLAYVAVSRGRYDAQIHTNDKSHLTEQLSRDVSHRSAMEQTRTPESVTQKIEPSLTLRQGAEETAAQGLNIGR